MLCNLEEREYQLDDIHARFEKARSAATFGWNHFHSKPPYSINEWANIDHRTWEDKYIHVSVLARRYIIALEFNVFNPKEADMLWKLQKE